MVFKKCLEAYFKTDTYLTYAVHIQFRTFFNSRKFHQSFHQRLYYTYLLLVFQVLDFIQILNNISCSFIQIYNRHFNFLFFCFQVREQLRHSHFGDQLSEAYSMREENLDRIETVICDNEQLVNSRRITGTVYTLGQ